MSRYRWSGGVALGILLTLLAERVHADVPDVFEVCVDPTTDVVPDPASTAPFPAAGDGFVAVGIIVRAGVIPPTPAGGSPPTCATFGGARIGTFFARGRVVSGLPSAEPDDVAYVSWHFRFAAGSFETAGPVKAAVPSFRQLVMGKSGEVDAGGAVTVVPLESTGFQFRLFLD